MEGCVGEYPFMLLARLVCWANKPLTYLSFKVVRKPRAPPSHTNPKHSTKVSESKEKQKVTHSRKSRKRKHQRKGLTSNWHATASNPADGVPTLQLRTCIRWRALSARVILAFLLILFCSACSVGAMQTSQGSLHSGHSMAPTTSGSHIPESPDLTSKASLLLQHELSQLHVSRFAATGTTEPTIKWYMADPSALDELSPDGIPEEPHDANWTIHPEGKWILGNHPEATPDQLQRLVDMLMEQKDAFAYSLNDLPGYAKPPIDLPLIDKAKRMWSPPRQYTEKELDFGDTKVKEMLEAGIVVEIPTTNPHAARITLPMKRAPDGSWTDLRFAVDLRQVNANTVVDKYGMPLPEDLFRRLRGAKYISKLDLRSGFWQIKLSQAAQQQVAFWWRGRLYTYTRLPFGHVNATAIFQRAIETELQASGVVNSAVFVDDVIVWSDNLDQHIEDMRRLLKHFKSVGLKAHPAKTVVGAQTIGYLGHLVSANQLQPEEAKLAAIKALQPPTSLKRLQAHLGLFNYYRCYVPNFSRIAQPLYQLLQKGAQYLWSDNCQKAYDNLKQALCTPGVALRQPDDSLPFHLYVDWSNNGIAAVLNQRQQDGTEYMVACASRSLNPAEKNYPAWKGEMLAAVWGVKHFRPYLLAREFFLHTDHRALLWLLTHKDPVGQQMRWILALQEYRFTLVHKPGISNPADVPSREPVSCSADTTGARLDYSMQDWPLPKVLDANMQPDPTVYTHDSLAQILGTNSSTGNEHKPSSNTTSNAMVGQLVQLLAEEPQVTYSWSQLQYEVFHCLLASNETVVDAVAPLPDSLLGGGSGHLFTPNSSTTDDLQHPAVAWRQQDLQRAAAAWVTLAAFQSTAPVPALPGKYEGQPDQHQLKPTQQLNTSDCSLTFFPAALEHGIVLWEPFGGLCAGLEMALRNGFTVKQYYYSDTDPTAQRVARHRIRVLQSMYPLQLPEDALQSAFNALPMDVAAVKSQHLTAAVSANTGTPWLIVAGWPCQDLSTAGSSKGLAGNRSGLLSELVRVVGMLQQLLPQLPPAYLIENVPFQHHYNQLISAVDFNTTTQIIGSPVTIDAAQFGSFAHRLRNYWTNLCAPNLLTSTLEFVKRPTGRTVQSILSPNRQAQPVLKSDQPPQYPCNKVNQPRSAWPTLVATNQSYAFRPGQPGSVMDTTDPANPRWDEPTAVEREVALGYLPGSTAAEGISELQRRQVLGQCIDANAAQAIMAIAKAWWLRQATQSVDTVHSSAATLAAQAAPSDASRAADLITDEHQVDSTIGPSFGHDHSLCSTAASGLLAAAPPHACSLTQYQYHCAVSLAAELLERSDCSGEQTADVWLDQPVLQVLRNNHSAGTQQGVVDNRARRRANSYYFSGDQLVRRFPDGSTRIVPQPIERAKLIQDLHHRYGHYGIRKTAAQVRNQYWWHGFWNDVVQVVSACEHCQRVNASFTAKPQQLTPIPISSVGFRWHVDTAGPLPQSRMGNKYILVSVEAFTKYLVAVPMKDKEASTTAYHFLHNVLSRFGAPGQVVSDGGGEFDAEFSALLTDSLIDHVHISTDHPQANGQAEKAVHIVKRALTKLAAAKHAVADWDTDVAWLVLGYCCSPQRSTGISPYELLYARAPVIPPAVQSAISRPVNYDDPDEAVNDLLIRKDKVAQMTPMALQNLTIAQHRDQLRYLKVRAADYEPKRHHFTPGQFVYVQQLQRYSTLQPRAQPVVYRVQEVKDSGVLTLQGKCGRTMDVHMSHCAPCHLLNIDGTVDPRLVEDVESIMCEVCGTDEHDQVLLICDICSNGYHTYCLHPPLDQVPTDEYWLCPVCVKEGYTTLDAEQRAAQREELDQRASQPNLYPNAAMKRRDEAAKQLDGRLIRQPFKDPTTGRRRLFWGKLHYRGEQFRPNYFLAVYEDGDSQYLSMQMAKKWLTPEGTTLPADVSIPTPTSLLARAADVPTQSFYLESSTGNHLFPCANVPTCDLQLLARFVQLSLAQHLADPITGNQQWQLMSGNRPFAVTGRLPHAATALFMSPTPSSLVPALHRALALKPAVVICYASNLVLPPAVEQLLQAFKAQQLATAVRGVHGWWFVITKSPLRIDLWLQ
eukprot:GHUV01001039.1.p1 GENE.GHUV01001039.1~~GHUV01001039.1.p1  ORF type:complete len:2125 (+),score=442.77 GHUV01001039.1:122-6376(+)